MTTILFALVAIAAFSVWAFGAKYFSSVASLYTSCALVFFMLGGLSLVAGLGGEGVKAAWGLVWVFPIAFLAFALLWCLGWFQFRNHFGEITGSALGIYAMTAILKWQLKFERSVLEAAAVVFFCYTLGYYLGEKAHNDFGGVSGQLIWGAGFGVGLGAGLAYLLQLPANSGS